MKTAMCVALLAGAAGTAMAQAPAVSSFSGGTPFGIYYGGSTGDVVGFRFTADVDMFVTHLGVYNDAAGDGVLDSAHQVGLWRNSDMALLASATVDSSGSLLGSFYYDAITSVQLNAGGQYTVGAMYTSTDLDSYISSPSSINTNGISATNGVYPAALDLNFSYPELDSTNLARFGANFQWKPVPAPSSLALLGLGGLAATRRRR